MKLNVNVYKANTLINYANEFCLMNPYIIASINNNVYYKSSAKEGGGLDPVFNEKFEFYVNKSQDILLNIEVLHEHNLLGKCKININSLNQGLNMFKNYDLYAEDSIVGSIDLDITIDCNINSNVVLNNNHFDSNQVVFNANNVCNNTNSNQICMNNGNNNIRLIDNYNPFSSNFLNMNRNQIQINTNNNQNMANISYIRSQYNDNPVLISTNVLPNNYNNNCMSNISINNNNNNININRNINGNSQIILTNNNSNNQNGSSQVVLSNNNPFNSSMININYK